MLFSSVQVSSIESKQSLNKHKTSPPGWNILLFSAFVETTKLRVSKSPTQSCSLETSNEPEQKTFAGWVRVRKNWNFRLNGLWVFPSDQGLCFASVPRSENFCNFQNVKQLKLWTLQTTSNNALSTQADPFLSNSQLKNDLLITICFKVLTTN